MPRAIADALVLLVMHEVEEEGSVVHGPAALPEKTPDGGTKKPLSTVAAVAADGVPSGVAVKPRTSRSRYVGGAGASGTTLVGGRGPVQKEDDARMAAMRSMSLLERPATHRSLIGLLSAMMGRRACHWRRARTDMERERERERCEREWEVTRERKGSYETSRPSLALPNSCSVPARVAQASPARQNL